MDRIMLAVVIAMALVFAVGVVFGVVVMVSMPARRTRRAAPRPGPAEPPPDSWSRAGDRSRRPAG